MLDRYTRGYLGLPWIELAQLLAKLVDYVIKAFAAMLAVSLDPTSFETAD